MSVRCPQGHENSTGSAFCSTCGVSLAPGAAIDGEQPAPSPSASPHIAPTAAYAPPADRKPSNGSRKALWIIGGAVLAMAMVITAVLAVVLGGGGSSSASSSGKQLRGIAMLLDTDGNITGSWDSCAGDGGYSDFQEGMRLSIKGKNDEIVGSGSVVNVTAENIDDVVEANRDADDVIGLENADDLEASKNEVLDFLQSGEGIMCMLYFTADIEPSEYYSIEMGNRGDLSYSRDELAEKGYVVSFSLGDF